MENLNTKELEVLAAKTGLRAYDMDKENNVNNINDKVIDSLYYLSNQFNLEVLKRKKIKNKTFRLFGDDGLIKQFNLFKK